MKKIYFILLLFLLLAVAGCNKQTADTNQAQENINTQTSVNQAAVETPAPDLKPYNIDALLPHNTEADCWLAINGKVYNVTEYIASHPGGKAILQGCGQDATTLFETRPMGSKTPHSDKARTKLEKYYIGELLPD